MKLLLSHLSNYTYASAIIMLSLTVHAGQAKKKAKKLKGSGRVTEIKKWENRSEFCYVGISFLFIATVFVTLIG